ncbi:hypothetical protein HDE_13390 [Halotydeus destructor]|nr:hypothetical protein HDE_13390 [Halotydeus destructor]
MMSKACVATIVAFVTLAVVLRDAEANGRCQQYGHSCLGGHGKRDGNDVMKGPFAARYNTALRDMIARLYDIQSPPLEWTDSQELGMDKKNTEYATV